ncbi:MAG: DUF1460 domain-containing protein, partial [Bdellovibrionales bacterium]|nr:DUF1460 domain-containing protein [Bdellovibrionales bacterium]
FDRNVSWSSRKHYLSSWCSDNCSRGFLIETTESLPDACETWKRLSVLEGLEPLDATYRTAPFSNNILKLLRPADVICFASDKLDLDYFHLGLLVKIDGELELFHASKSLGSIAFENLQGFCERTQCSRISVYRVPIKNDISSE